MNKKGFSLGGWLEVGVGVILFIVCIGIIISNLNANYSTNYNPTFNIISNSTLESIENLQSTLQEGLKGEASISSFTGISLGTAWGITLTVIKIAINIITGSWIENAVGLLGWGEAGMWLALILRLIFIASLVLILLRLILKINP